MTSMTHAKTTLHQKSGIVCMLFPSGPVHPVQRNSFSSRIHHTTPYRALVQRGPEGLHTILRLLFTLSHRTPLPSSPLKMSCPVPQPHPYNPS